jgi:PKD repeat protein
MKSFLSLFSLLFCFQLVAQNEIPGIDYRMCSTAEKYNEIKKNNPLIKILMDQQNQFAQEWTKNNYGKTKVNANGKKVISYIIPVVWHVIHNGGAENISKATIENEIAQLNEDFQKLNASISGVHPLFAGITADCEIEFRLARIDPNGNCTEGITRTKSTHTYLMDDPYTVRPSWNTPTRKYLNIWQGTQISFGAGGYAYYPGTVPDDMEGIVLIAQQLGNTVTHEVGHWLNLAHLWGNSNDPQDPNNCFDDDDVLDTPNTIGRTGCRDTANSCGSIDNVQNYMEYNFCDLMFTEGQKQRMHAALNSSAGARDYLVSQANLINTGVADPYDLNPICTPLADFNYNKTYICEGEQVTFTDNSFNATPTLWDWTFIGGTPTTSNIQNPVITYNTKGVYSVIHRPGTTTGSGYNEKNDIIYVSGINADYGVLPYSESFENITTYNNDWLVIENAANNWQNVSTTGFTGTRSVMVENLNNSSTEISELISPSYDLTTNPSYTLTFKYAFAQKLSGGNDRLVVYYSSNCGKSWSILRTKIGASLATAPKTNSFFVPTPNQWREEIIDLTSLSHLNNMKFKFYVKNSGGNNIWLDDINIDVSASTAINENVNLSNYTIYPNPTNESAVVSFTISNNVKQLSITLKDLLGKEVTSIVNSQTFHTGKYTLSIDQGKKLASGVYLVEFNLDGLISTQKLIVH